MVETHSHTVDEVIYIVEGSLTLGDRTCGPGTVLAIEKDTEYSFTVGQEGVRFLNIRPGLDTGTGGPVRSGCADPETEYRREPFKLYSLGEKVWWSHKFRAGIRVC